MISLSRLYAILDPSLLNDSSPFGVAAFLQELIAGGASLIQLRDKSGSANEVLKRAREMRRVTHLHSEHEITLMMNDRADLCLAADFHGVHVGQDDLSPEGARKVIGVRRLGVSTHTAEQVRIADKTSADYIAVGPVFATGSKLNPDPAIGLEGIRIARQLTAKPLVAIGGITLDNCRSVLAAGADSVAAISALLESPRKRTEAFLRELG